MMRLLSFISLVLLMISHGNAQGNDHSLNLCADHESLVNDYFENENQFKVDREDNVIQVIIADLEGNIIRQMELKGNVLEKNSWKNLRPMIDKSAFLTEIGGILYFLYPGISEIEKKIT